VALIGLAHMLYFKSDLTEAEAVNIEAVKAGRERGDNWAIAFGSFGRALVAFEQGRHGDAAVHADEAVRVGRLTDGVEAGPLLVLGNLALMKGDVDRALEHFDESNLVNRRNGEIWGLGIGLLVAAGARMLRQDFSSARAQISEALALNEQLEDPRGIGWSLESLAGLFGATGHAREAARLWAATDRVLESTGLSISFAQFIKWIRERYMDGVKASLGPEAYQAASAEGRAMSTAEAIAYARQQERLLE
jgi:tetratricopeptide (TPR) repeat protein